MTLSRPVDRLLLDSVFQPLCNLLGERQFDVARFLIDGGAFCVIVGLSLSYVLFGMPLSVYLFGIAPMPLVVFSFRRGVIRSAERDVASGRPNNGRYAFEMSRLTLLAVSLMNAGLDWNDHRFNIDDKVYLVGWIICTAALYLACCQRPPPKPVMRSLPASG